MAFVAADRTRGEPHSLEGAPLTLRHTGRAFLASVTRLTRLFKLKRLGWKSGKAHTGFEPVSRETEVPEPLRRKLDELRAQSKKRADERH